MNSEDGTGGKVSSLKEKAAKAKAKAKEARGDNRVETPQEKLLAKRMKAKSGKVF